ncbi:uncharacterized protein LOC143246666 [Tachypleus tridentatus]|uniref:uncharacterized protein LOC143246666 n=1 Tax=Tachypleus tridentatus TaxID=6853 RepID=UPI003FD3C31E
MMNILVALFVLQCGSTVLATDKTDSPENNRSPALRYGPDYPYDNRYGDYPDVNRYDRWRGGYYPSDNRYYDRYSNNNGYYYRDPYGDRYDSRWYGRNPYNYPYGDRGSEYYPNNNRFYPDGSRFDNRVYGGRYPSDSRYGYFYPYYNRYGYGRYLRSENNGVNTSPLPPGYVPQDKYAANVANPQSLHFRLKPPGGRNEFIRSFSASENSEKLQ